MVAQDNNFLKPNGGTTPESGKDKEENPQDVDALDEPHTALDQMEIPGGLEVEDMPESNELQERRRKTKNRLREMTNTEEATTPAGDVFGGDDSGGLMDLLREANLSTRHLKFCCGGVLGVVLLVGLFFGGKSLWNYWQNRPETPVVEDGGTVVPDEGDDGFIDSSILGGVLVGEELSEEDEATGIGENVGQNENSADAFTQVIIDFGKLYESMQVDLNQLLAASTNRRDTLSDYVNELNFLVYTAQQNVQRLTAESDGLVAQFNTLETDKNTEEQRYFDKLRDLDAYGAVAALNAFETKGEEVVRLRAEYNARQKLISYYEQVLSNVDARLKDIDSNEEALVKGIRVTDIEGSDLELIIDGSQL